MSHALLPMFSAFVPPHVVNAAALALCGQDHPHLTESPCLPCTQRAIATVEAAVVAIDPTFGRTEHILVLGEDRWTLQHPLSCWPRLAACPLHEDLTDIEDWSTVKPGEYPVLVDGDRVTVAGIVVRDGELTIAREDG
ncbi:hypothetical protein [Micromonospora andamanensis]|uniref:hypothetical protein n=1 Tax=Micromonospora andamanensis TaxID=1287068 RepID=UPI0019506A72|nr:hypothetical protein [Micromonospora andamanensis]GIJ40501.1 hypothetical protein Vwe01_38260 [Micromonospora andamanensis]